MRSVRYLKARLWAWRIGRALARAQGRGDAWEVRILRAAHMAAEAVAREDFEAAEVLTNLAEELQRRRRAAMVR